MKVIILVKYLQFEQKGILDKTNQINIEIYLSGKMCLEFDNP